ATIFFGAPCFPDPPVLPVPPVVSGFLVVDVPQLLAPVVSTPKTPAATSARINRHLMGPTSCSLHLWRAYTRTGFQESTRPTSGRCRAEQRVSLSLAITGR